MHLTIIIYSWRHLLNVFCKLIKLIILANDNLYILLPFFKRLIKSFFCSSYFMEKTSLNSSLLCFNSILLSILYFFFRFLILCFLQFFIKYHCRFSSLIIIFQPLLSAHNSLDSACLDPSLSSFPMYFFVSSFFLSSIYMS